MDAHLDTHYSYFCSAWPVVGRVMVVVPKNDPRNVTSTVTLYDIEVYTQRPSTTALLEMVPYLGQSAGGGSEGEDPLVVGQYVIVLFLEGDPNRPVIVGSYLSHDTAVAQTAAEHPHTRIVRRGLNLTVDKDGSGDVQIAAGRAVRVLNSAGTVLFRVTDAGDVELGGSSGINTLLLSTLVAWLNSNWQPLIGGAIPIPPGHTTTITKAK